MIGNKKVEAIRSSWHARAVEKFLESSKATDAEIKRACSVAGETLAICAEELKQANAEE